MDRMMLVGMAGRYGAGSDEMRAALEAFQKGCPHPAGKIYEVPEVVARTRCGGREAFRLCLWCGLVDSLKGHRFPILGKLAFPLNGWQYKNVRSQLEAELGVSGLPEVNL